MAARRGDHGISWDRVNKRYVGTISLGYDEAGRRRRRTVRGRTKAEVRDKLAVLEREISSGVQTSSTYTVRSCVEDWLSSLALKPGTIDGKRSHARTWIYPRIGSVLIRDLKVSDLDRVFAAMAGQRRHQTLKIVRSILRNSLRRAQKHDLIQRNVAELCDLPQALPARKSNAMTVDQAELVLRHTEGTRLHALFVLSFTLGMRPGELRALRWDDIDLDTRVIKVRRQLKNEQSERTLRIPEKAAHALKLHRGIQSEEAAQIGSEGFPEVFCHEDGTPYAKEALRYRWIKVTRELGLGDWHPHEGRHTAVSILHSRGVPLPTIADFVGHKNDNVTKTVYRHLIEPEISAGADVMDDVFR